jgi:hypothetical protein
MRGIVLLDTLMGISIISVALLSTAIIVQQAMSSSRHIIELRQHYFSSCNETARFREGLDPFLGEICQTDNGTYISIEVVEGIHFEAIR